MPTRSAIIFSCPGQGNQRLPGVVQDVKNFTNYLCSPKGGMWKTHEIIVLNDPSYGDALWYTENIEADFQYIYFTGHGCSEANARLLAFKDALVPDTWLLNNNPRQIIIVDACRSYLPAISGIPEAEDVWSSFDGIAQSRAHFDWHIENSPFGKMIVHATHDGSVANDISHLGGAFSYTLLQTAMKFNTGLDYSPVRIEQLLPHVARQLNIDGYRQTPGIVYRIGSLRVPFMIDAPQILKERVYVEPEFDLQPTLNLLPLLGAGLAIYGLSKFFNNRT